MKPRRVLVVAADAAIRRHIRDNLFVCGYAVFEAADRNSALAAVIDFAPQLLVADLASDERHSVLATLISDLCIAAPKRPRVLAITGNAPGTLPTDATGAGADDYLSHPICIGELLVRADRLFGVALPPPRNDVRPREQPRLSDLLEGEAPITLAWITLAGIEHLAGVGIDGHGLVAREIAPLLADLVDEAHAWWAGTERIAVIGSPCGSAAELTTAMTQAIAKLLADLSLPVEVKLRVRAGVRHWSEGKASFVARVTGRLSHAGLPTAPLGSGRPATTTAAAVRTGLDRQHARKELGRLIADGGR